MFRYIQKSLERADWTPLDAKITLFFVFVLMIGVVFFIWTQLANFELRGPFTRRLFYLFPIVAFSYLIWLTDLVFGLPFGWSRFQVVSVLMGTGLAVFFLAGFMTYLNEKKIPIAKGYKRCSRCKKIILGLSTECPKCGYKVRKRTQ